MKNEDQRSSASLNGKLQKIFTLCASFILLLNVTAVQAALVSTNPEVVDTSSHSTTVSPKVSQFNNYHVSTIGYAQFVKLHRREQVLYIETLRYGILEAETAQFNANKKSATSERTGSTKNANLNLNFHAIAEVGEDPASDKDKFSLFTKFLSDGISLKFRFLNQLATLGDFRSADAWGAAEGAACFYAGWVGRVGAGSGDCEVDETITGPRSSGLVKCNPRAYGYRTVQKGTNQLETDQNCDNNAANANDVAKALTLRSRESGNSEFHDRRRASIGADWNSYNQQIATICKERSSEVSCVAIQKRLAAAKPVIDAASRPRAGTTTAPPTTPPTTVPAAAAAHGANERNVAPAAAQPALSTTLAPTQAAAPPAPAVAVATIPDAIPAPRVTAPDLGGPAVPVGAAGANAPTAAAGERQTVPPSATSAAPATGRSSQTRGARRARTARGNSVGADTRSPSGAIPVTGAGSGTGSRGRARARRGAGQPRTAQVADPNQPPRTPEQEEQISEDQATSVAKRELGRADNGGCEPNLLVQTMSLPCAKTSSGYVHPELCDGNNDANLVMSIEDAQSLYCGNPPKIDEAKIAAAKDKVAQVLKNISLLSKKDQNYFRTMTESYGKNLDACVDLARRRVEQKMSIPKNGGHQIIITIHGNMMMREEVVPMKSLTTGQMEPTRNEVIFMENDITGYLDRQGANVCNLVLHGSRSAHPTFNTEAEQRMTADDIRAAWAEKLRRLNGGGSQTPPAEQQDPQPATDPVPPHGRRRRSQ